MTNKKNNKKKKMTNNLKIKTRSKTSVGIFTAVIAAILLGGIIYFAFFALPAGCSTEDGVTKCKFEEKFDNTTKIDLDMTDPQMQISSVGLVLNPSEQIKLTKGEDFDSAPTKQICGLLCAKGECYEGLTRADMATVNIDGLTKDGADVQASANFLDLGSIRNYDDFPYALNFNILRENREQNNMAMAMVESSNPEVAIAYNGFFGTKDAPVLPISPGRTQMRVDTCGEERGNYFATVNEDGFANFNPQGSLDTRFIQGLAMSKNVSANTANYNIESAEVKENIAPTDNMLQDDRLKGNIIILMSNDDGKTWYVPSRYSENNGDTWQEFETEEEYYSKAVIIDINERILGYDFNGSSGNKLKWAVMIQSQEYENVLVEQGLENIPGVGDIEEIPIINPVGGGADNFDIGMTWSGFIQDMSDANPMLAQDVLSGGIISIPAPDGQPGATYSFFNRSFFDDYANWTPNLEFKKDNVRIRSLTEEVLTVHDGSAGNGTLEASKAQGHSTDDLPSVNVVISGKKAGYGKIRVDYSPDGWAEAPEASLDEVDSLGNIRANKIAIEGDYAYVLAESDVNFFLHIVDISDPDNLWLTSNFLMEGGSLNDIHVNGNYVYIANGREGIKIIDVADKISPQEIASIDGNAQAVYVDNNYIYASADGDFVVYNKGTRIPIGSTPVPFATQIYIEGNYAYVTSLLGGLRIIDISDPTSPQELSYFNPDNQQPRTATVIVDDYAYLANANNGIWIINISDKNNPSEVGNFDSLALDLAVSGNSLYVAKENEGVQLVSIADRENPVEVASSNTTGPAIRIAAQGGYAYVAEGLSGLQNFELNEQLNQNVISKEFGFLVLPQAYLNLDNLDIEYTISKSGEEEIPSSELENPGQENPSETEEDTGDVSPEENVSISPTKIYRGHNRVIVKAEPNDDFSKDKMKSAFDAGNLKFKYGTNKSKLDQSAKVYFDDRDNKYYTVLRELKGGKKDGYNQGGFENGRMKYFYRFKIGDKGVYTNQDKTTTLAKFKTLNRKRTVMYYYNWIFDRKYNLDKDYNWDEVQKGGLMYWYKTNITLPGIRFMMLNDRKFEEFNKYLGKKKKTKKMVNWLMKKELDRIYDNNLYKFADQGGIDYWYRQMTKINQQDRISKVGVKFAISASKEYRSQLEEFFASKKDANAEFAYNVVLKRGDDEGGLQYLVENFSDSPKAMRENLANSFEYNNRLEQINEELGRKATIAELYETLYARPADIAGVDYWDGTGKSLPEIKEEFLHSDEFENVLK